MCTEQVVFIYLGICKYLEVLCIDIYIYVTTIKEKRDHEFEKNMAEGPW